MEMKDYRELAGARREVADAQRRRLLANESLPENDWATKLAALRASGLVEERRRERND